MTPREMLTASIRLIIEEQLDAALASRGLAALTAGKSREAWRAHAVLVVLNAVAEEFETTVVDIRAPGREQPAALARQVCVCLLRDLADFSRSHAIRAVGRTDPTTCYHANKAVREMAEKQPTFGLRFDRLREKIARKLQAEHEKAAS